MHTVFSDGEVWPTVRVEEAWRNGLDAFSITDHVEQREHYYKDDIRIDLNRSFELARARAEALGLTIIRGAEITPSMPPGHFNAIFLKDITPLENKNYKDAIKAAVDQGAFIMWNHPGWTGQQPDGIPRWYQDHTDLYEKDWMHGIEVVNEREYYPLVHQWCLEKKLTMMGNSDIHHPTNMAFDFAAGQHRTMTLVFANENTKEAIKETLFARRTVVYWNNILIGEGKYLKAIFDESVTIDKSTIELKGKERKYIQITNNSDINFELELNRNIDKISVPEEITLYAGKTILFEVRGKKENTTGKKQITVPYIVKNLKVSPDARLEIEIKLNITFIR